MTLNLALFLVLALLQALDYHTTLTILSCGGKELNPMMSWLMDRLGIEQALIFKGIAVLAVAGFGFYDNAVALGIMVAVFVAVIIWNFRQMPK